MRSTSLVAALAFVGFGAVASAQVPIARVDADGMRIAGTVAGVYGSYFVLEDDSGSILVETGPNRLDGVGLEQGDRVEVVGEPDEGSFDAFVIVREGGERVEIRSPDGPPPWAGPPAWAREAMAERRGDGPPRWADDDRDDDR